MIKKCQLWLPKYHHNKYFRTISTTIIYATSIVSVVQKQHLTFLEFTVFYCQFFNIKSRAIFDSVFMKPGGESLTFWMLGGVLQMEVSVGEALWDASALGLMCLMSLCLFYTAPSLSRPDILERF